MRFNFGRVITAMVTPFDSQGQVDYGRAAELAARLVEQGSDGLVVAGTTGESPTLTSDEKLQLFRTVVEAVGRRVRVVAGTGSNNTASSADLTRRAEETGVAGVMLVTPYYNKPPQEGLYLHFRTVAEATKLPVILYNVPGRTGCNLAPATASRLARDLPNVAAVKEAAGSLDQATELIRALPDGVAVYSGDDSLTLPMLAVGGAGVISVASHLVARQLADLVDAYQSGRVAEAARLHRRLYPLMKAIFVTANPIPVKAALSMLGFDCGPVRPPLCPLTDAEAGVVRQALRELELIPA